ncbi:hypothetical protein V8C43DRAFT_41853 [Trichoderma afarasin]
MMVLCNLDFLRLGRGTKRKVMGTMVLVTCTGSISRYMKARLSQKIKGGLACFVFLPFFFFSSTFTFFCILGHRGLESSHLRFLSSTAFGRGQGGYVSRASRGFLYFYLLTGNILPRPCSFFILFFHFFIILSHLRLYFFFPPFVFCSFIQPFQQNSRIGPVGNLKPKKILAGTGNMVCH